MHTCVILKPSEVTNMTYFFVLGGHYPLFLEVNVDEKEKNVCGYFFPQTFYYLGTR